MIFVFPIKGRFELRRQGKAWRRVRRGQVRADGLGSVAVRGRFNCIFARHEGLRGESDRQRHAVLAEHRQHHLSRCRRETAQPHYECRRRDFCNVQPNSHLPDQGAVRCCQPSSRPDLDLRR